MKAMEEMNNKKRTQAPKLAKPKSIPFLPLVFLIAASLGCSTLLGSSSATQASTTSTPISPTTHPTTTPLPTATTDPVLRGAGRLPVLLPTNLGEIHRVKVIDSDPEDDRFTPVVFTFNTSGERMAFIDPLGTLVVVDTLSWQTILSLDNLEYVKGFAFTPDGHGLVTIGYATQDDYYSENAIIEVWDLESQAERWQARLLNPDGSLDFSPDGKWLAAGGARNNPRLWDLATGQAGPELNAETQQPSQAVHFSPDGRWLIYWQSANFGQGWVRWKFEAGAEPVPDSIWAKSDGSFRTSHSQGLVATTIYIYNGELLDEPLVIVFDENSGKEISRFNHGGTIYDIEMSTPAQLVATLGETEVSVWDLAEDAEGWYIPIPSRPQGQWTQTQELAFSPDGNLLAVTTAQSVLLVDTQAGKTLAELELPFGKARLVQFSPDGTRLVAADQAGLIYLWDISDDPTVVAEPIQMAEGTPKVALNVAGANGAVCTLQSDSQVLAVGRDEPYVAAYSNGPDCEGLFFLSAKQLANIDWDLESAYVLVGLPDQSLGAVSLPEGDPFNLALESAEATCENASSYGARPQQSEPLQVYDAKFGDFGDYGPGTQPATTKAIDVLICHKEQPIHIRQCGYYGWNTLQLYRSDLLLQLINVETGDIFAEEYFQGPDNSSCPQMYNFGGEGKDLNNYGNPPDLPDWTDWVTNQLTSGSITRTTVNTDSATVYIEPSAESEVVAELAADTPVNLLARSEDGDWLGVLLPDFKLGWIQRSNLTISTLIDPETLPVIQGQASGLPLLPSAP